MVSTTLFIILLHGLGAHPITMIGIEKYLNWHGYNNTINLSYPANTYNLIESIDFISAKLIEKSINCDSEIVIIGQPIERSATK